MVRSRFFSLNNSASNGFFIGVAGERRLKGREHACDGLPAAGRWIRRKVRLKRNKGRRDRRDSPYSSPGIRGLSWIKARAVGINYGFFKGLIPPSFEPFFTELFFAIFLSPSLLIYPLERCTVTCMRRAKTRRRSESRQISENRALTKSPVVQALRPCATGAE
ncbi:MAG: hypothetical protein WB995_17940 [Candidatus Acidiferrales bacterium]